MGKAQGLLRRDQRHTATIEQVDETIPDAKPDRGLSKARDAGT